MSKRPTATDVRQAFDEGHAAGVVNGREQMRAEFRDLLGVSSSDRLQVYIGEVVGREINDHEQRRHR